MTHSVFESVFLSDRIVIMESGSILAEGSPDEVHAANRRVEFNIVKK